MFGRSNNNRESEISATFRPATLKSIGERLETVCTPRYKVLDESYLKEQYKKAEDKLISIIDTTDKYSIPSVCDAFVAGQMKSVYADFHDDVALNDYLAHRIEARRRTRHKELYRQRDILSEQIGGFQKAIEPLEGLHSQYELQAGPFRLAIGIPITLAAMAVDGALNYSYLQGILLQSVFLLIVCVACLSVMSDGSMFCLGILLSHRKEEYMNKWLFRTAVVGLALMFLLSVVASCMIRFGSMNVTFGSIDATGQFVGKEAYTLAEWGVALVTAFLTTTTGLISLVFSVDENAHLVSRRMKMEKSLYIKEKELETILVEIDSIENAESPKVLNQARLKAAEESIEALSDGLMLFMRKLLILHQKDSSYTDGAAESAMRMLSKDAAEDAIEDTTGALSNNYPSDILLVKPSDRSSACNLG